MKDLIDLVGGDDDGAGAIEIVVEERVVKLLTKKYVKPERRFVEYQQARFDRLHNRRLQLSDHTLGEMADLAGALDLGFGQ